MLRIGFEYACLWGLGLCLPLAGWAQNGIFADFETSHGSFTCELHYERSPQAVANFMALATGGRPWMEEATGRVLDRPYYDGIRFHRVIAGFMIQGGSPNGLGTDGPGYVFPDAFDPALRHDRPGVLSMANSGPNSNGSQFFITVAATPWLDDVHTVFGRVVEGYAVVQAISTVAVDEQDRPREPVRMERVRIRRVGAAAEAFDLHDQELPDVMGMGLGIGPDGEGWVLSYDQPLHAELRLLQSADLRAWTSSGLGIEVGAAGSGATPVGRDFSERYFAMTRVQYPRSTHAPRSLAGQELTLTFADGLGTMRLELDGDGGGTYAYRPVAGAAQDGTITSLVWVQEAYRGRTTLHTSGLYPMTFRLDFSAATAGALVGTVHAPTPFGVTGSFELVPPAG